ncbi:MAG: hypothetical protein H7125_17645 [Proteobacteria bacterium]|nr:hypothetical protein [Burkholderiales bacterium]
MIAAFVGQMLPVKWRRWRAEFRALAMLCLMGLQPTLSGAQTFVAATAPAPAAGAVSSMTITRNNSWQSGDVLLAVFSQRGQTVPIVSVVPAGWTLVRRQGDGVSLLVEIYVRVVINTEPASYTFPFTATEQTAGAIMGFRSVDTTNPVMVSGAQSNASSVSVTAPSIATNGTSLLVGVFSTVNGDGSISPPTGMTERFDIRTQSGAGGVVLEAATAAGASGNTGTRVATSSSAQVNVGALIALRPTAPVPPPPPPPPTSFNAFETTTPAGSATGVIQTKTAGASYSIAVVALNSARTAVNTSYTSTATYQLVDARNNSGPLDANGCRSTWVAIPGTTNIAFTASGQGRVTITRTESNAWREVRVRITGPSERVGCSTDAFAVKPSALQVTARDATWQTADTGNGVPRALTNAATSGGVVHGAGLPFTLSATGLSGPKGTTSGYDGTPTVRSGSPVCVQPAACVNGTLAFSGWTSVTGGGGVATGERRVTNATYSEVGTFTLELEDATFADIDAADTPAAQRTVPQSAALTVGRFVPAYYDLQPSATAPLLRTMNYTDSQCLAAPPGTPRRAFTYVGQPFGFATLPQATILARNASGALTANYRGTLWKLDPGQIVRGLNASATTPAAQPVTVNLGALAAADVVSNANGTGTVTASSLDAITYTRNTTTPQATFTANITAQMSVSDATEAGPAGNPATIPTTAIACFNGGGTCAVPGTGIAFDSAIAGFPGNEFRYGRLRLANANGSELTALPVPMFAEYWNGSAWVANTRDHCTTVAASNLTLSNYQRNLAAGETTPTITGAMAAGSRSIVFSAPGSGNAGSVDLSLNLSAAGANLPWLQGAWTSTTFDQNPSARATFGTSAAPSPIIFRRERF